MASIVVCERIDNACVHWSSFIVGMNERGEEHFLAIGGGVRINAELA